MSSSANFWAAAAKILRSSLYSLLLDSDSDRDVKEKPGKAASTSV